MTQSALSIGNAEGIDSGVGLRARGRKDEN